MNDYLMHFGIPGQKWGERRFQNEDGTLTPAGKVRYGSDTRGITRGLNKFTKRYEKAYAKRQETLSDASEWDAWTKRLKRKGKDTSKLEARLKKKYQARYDKNSDEMKRSIETVKDIIRSAKDKNISIYSKYTTHTVFTGKQILFTMLGDYTKPYRFASEEFKATNGEVPSDYAESYYRRYS